MTTPATKYRVGQWVRVQTQGTLVLTEIRYVRTAKRWPHDVEYVTDDGTFSESAIVEAR